MSLKTKALLTTLLLFSLFLGHIESRSRTFHASYKVSWFKGSPDGFEREILGFDGNFPPAIRISKGYSVRTEIKNLIKPNQLLDIHHHGIFQKGTLTADGVGGTTQCDPLFGQKYVYEFNPGEQTGTYWYHSHAGLQFTDGLRAPFIIDDPEDPFLKPFNYYIDKKYVKIFNDKRGKVSSKLFYVDHSKVDKCKEPDSVIFLTDWHHTKADILGAWFLSPQSGGNEPTPDSALINNKGDYYCRNPPDCQSMYETKIVTGKAKKFRIINGSSMAVFHFAIQGHKLHIVETDGITLDGTTVVDTLRINAGQRYSVIVKADQEPRNYWIRAKMDDKIYPEGTLSPNWQPEIFGELMYTSNCGSVFSKNRPSESSFRSMDDQLQKSIDDGMINIDMDVPLVPMRYLYPSPPETSTKKIILNIKPVTATDGTQYLGFNDIVYYMPMDTTVLGQILNHEPYDKTFQKNDVTFGINSQDIQKGDIVDLIINNLDGMEHPMHGHGHAFYVMYQGETGSSDYITSPKDSYKFAYNQNAALRDTISVNGNSVLVLRFVADNPGAWVFHCHIDWHLFAGLMATIIEDKRKIRKLYKKYINKVTKCEMPGVHIGDTWGFDQAPCLTNKNNVEKQNPSNLRPKVQKQTLIQKSHKLRHAGHSDKTVIELPRENKSDNQIDIEIIPNIIEEDTKEKNEDSLELVEKIKINNEEKINEGNNVITVKDENQSPKVEEKINQDENKGIDTKRIEVQGVEENKNIIEKKSNITETSEIPSSRVEKDNLENDAITSSNKENLKTEEIELDNIRDLSNKNSLHEIRKDIPESKLVEVLGDLKLGDEQQETSKVLSESKHGEYLEDQKINEEQVEIKKNIPEVKLVEISRDQKIIQEQEVRKVIPSDKPVEISRDQKISDLIQEIIKNIPETKPVEIVRDNINSDKTQFEIIKVIPENKPVEIVRDNINSDKTQFEIIKVIPENKPVEIVRDNNIADHNQQEIIKVIPEIKHLESKPVEIVRDNINADQKQFEIIKVIPEIKPVEIISDIRTTNKKQEPIKDIPLIKAKEIIRDQITIENSLQEDQKNFKPQRKDNENLRENQGKKISIVVREEKPVELKQSTNIENNLIKIQNDEKYVDAKNIQEEKKVVSQEILQNEVLETKKSQNFGDQKEIQLNIVDDQKNENVDKKRLRDEVPSLQIRSNTQEKDVSDHETKLKSIILSPSKSSDENSNEKSELKKGESKVVELENNYRNHEKDLSQLQFEQSENKNKYFIKKQGEQNNIRKQYEQSEEKNKNYKNQNKIKNSREYKENIIKKKNLNHVKIIFEEKPERQERQEIPERKINTIKKQLIRDRNKRHDIDELYDNEYDYDEETREISNVRNKKRNIQY